MVQPFVLLEFAVRTVKSVLALLSAIGRISVTTRRFVQVQLYKGSRVRLGRSPGVEVASGGRAASGSKVGRVYI
jgi:hypothetical protein